MEHFSIVEGRLSSRYNHFAEFNLTKVVATDTRLMGVVALKLDWTHKKEEGRQYYQVIHLDFSEYGIDDYFEFEVDPTDEETSENNLEADFRWTVLTSALGANIEEIPISLAVALIEKSYSISTKSRFVIQGIDKEKPFRSDAIERLRLMEEALINDKVVSKDFCKEYSTDELIAAVSPKSLKTYETINYFIMRLVDCDIEAASYLSDIPSSKLKASKLITPGIQTLIKTEISGQGQDEFRVLITTLAEEEYYYSSVLLTLDGTNESINRRIKTLDVAYFKALSTFEAAMNIMRTEYITVYDVDDEALMGFDMTKFSKFKDANIAQCHNGWKLTKYKSHNSHVDKANYHISGDIYACLLFTVAGELVLMSHEIVNAVACERDIEDSIFRDYIHRVGQYKTKAPIFQSLIDSAGAILLDLTTFDDLKPRDE